MKKLENLREEIDRIDLELVQLLEQRASLVLEVKEAKAESNIDIYSPAREKEIRDRVQKLAKEGNFPRETLDSIFSSIVGATRSLIGTLSIAYQGPRWSPAYQASLRQFGADVDLHGFGSVEEVFTSCRSGETSYGVVPLETSTGGLVSRTCSAFVAEPENNLSIVAEVVIRQGLSLFSKAEKLDQIDLVYSSAGNFLNSENWLQRNLPKIKKEVVIGVDTLDSLLKNNPQAAFIAPEEIVGDSDFNILCRSIESDGQTATVEGASRFVVLGSKPASPSSNDKTSLICSVPEKVGALHEVLQFFADRNVNLSKIESKKLVDQSQSKENMIFFIDLVGNIKQAELAAATADLGKVSLFCRVLGSYPSAVLAC